MKVLVTGAKGFIGSNLIKRLKKMYNIDIIEFNRDNTWKELENNIDYIDFIYHFAAKILPKGSDEKFEKSNACLINSIINIIEKRKKKIPFLFASSIHAEFKQNAYGISKREAEIYLENYGKQNHTPVWIYRLPHVFGEGCKPNYNSVISTWIYNSIHDKEIVVFDRATPMTYIYVQDIIDEFVAYLNYGQNTCNINSYFKPKITYYTTLGEVIDYIEEFKNSSKENLPHYNGFKAKLYATYLDYYEKRDHNDW